ncbi:MAG TPA: redox-sensing transcriptional repressor Rex [Acidimicrobiia bacterium]
MSELSPATVARLPRYLRLLEEHSGWETVSSATLAEAARVTAANVRRDLASLGFQGTRGVGYSTAALADRIRRELGLDKRRRVGIIGAGNLGTALAGYTALAKRGFDVTAVYDNDSRRIGATVAGLTIRDTAVMPDDVRAGVFDMAILAVPASAAQTVADLLVEAGIRSMLNFAPIRIEVPDGVAVRQVDLSHELQVLSYYG